MTIMQTHRYSHLIAGGHDTNSRQLVAADLCHTNCSQQTNLAGSQPHSTRQHQLIFLDITADRSARQHQPTWTDSLYMTKYHFKLNHHSHQSINQSINQSRFIHCRKLQANQRCFMASWVAVGRLRETVWFIVYCTSKSTDKFGLFTVVRKQTPDSYTR